MAWRLGEPGAGSLDAAGNYVAPTVPGRYTVRVASVDDPTMAAMAAVKVVPEPPQTLFAPDTFLPGAKGLEARVPELEGMTYAWEIEGGTFTTGADGPSVLFDAGPGPAVTLRCRITNEAGDSFAAMKVITVLQ